MSYLKAWFEWMTNTYKNVFNNEDPILKGLALRNYNHLVERFLD